MYQLLMTLLLHNKVFQSRWLKTTVVIIAHISGSWPAVHGPLLSGSTHSRGCMELAGQPGLSCLPEVRGLSRGGCNSWDVLDSPCQWCLSTVGFIQKLADPGFSGARDLVLGFPDRRGARPGFRVLHGVLCATLSWAKEVPEPPPFLIRGTVPYHRLFLQSSTVKINVCLFVFSPTPIFCILYF